MAILRAENLSAGYENGDVIKNISFVMNRGDFLTIMGPNGSGKSTLIKALQGLLRNVSGRVEVEALDLSELKPGQAAKKIAYVPQTTDSSFDFSVQEIVMMGRYIHQTRWGRSSDSDLRTIQEVMALAEINDLRHKKLAHLSGGEKQRVLIARALAQDAPLLFLDEPSSHLDINYQVEIYKILKRLQFEKGKTILSTEHNINLAIPYSQRILLLKDGQIHALGPPDRLITQENIREVFQAEVDIRQNPRTGLPEISLISGLEES